MYSKDEIEDICLKVIEELIKKREKNDKNDKNDENDENDSLIELLLLTEDLNFLSTLLNKLDK